MKYKIMYIVIGDQRLCIQWLRILGSNIGTCIHIYKKYICIWKY